MATNKKVHETTERKFASAAAAEWNRVGYDYSNLWHMFDSIGSVRGNVDTKEVVAR